MSSPHGSILEEQSGITKAPLEKLKAVLTLVRGVGQWQPNLRFRCSEENPCAFGVHEIVVALWLHGFGLHFATKTMRRFTCEHAFLRTGG